jgi:hypothetical protein
MLGAALLVLLLSLALKTTGADDGAQPRALARVPQQLHNGPHWTSMQRASAEEDFQEQLWDDVQAEQQKEEGPCSSSGQEHRMGAWARMLSAWEAWTQWLSTPRAPSSKQRIGRMLRQADSEDFLSPHFKR